MNKKHDFGNQNPTKTHRTIKNEHEMKFRQEVLNSGEFSDISFLVGRTKTRIFKVHRFVLMGGSQKFKEILTTRNNDEPIAIPGIEPDIFEQLLK